MSNRASANIVLKDIKQQFADMLRRHPEEKKNSTGYVHDHLELKHVKAALWMFKHHQTQLNAYNLHHLIENYDQYKTLAEFSPKDMMIYYAEELEPGAFNPVHLIAYFSKNQP